MKTIKERFDLIVAEQNLAKPTWLESIEPYIQAAFSIAVLFAANELLVAIWRSMTGH